MVSGPDLEKKTMAKKRGNGKPDTPPAGRQTRSATRRALHALSVQELRGELQSAVFDLHVCDPEAPAPSRAVRQRVEQLLHEMARRGPQHAIHCGFEAASSLVALLLLRLRDGVSTDLQKHDAATQHGRLDLPAEILAAVWPALDGLAHLQTMLADSHAKFTHVIDLAERTRAAEKAPRRARHLDRSAARQGGSPGVPGAAGRDPGRSADPQVRQMWATIGLYARSLPRSWRRKFLGLMRPVVQATVSP
jgi:hypothetical protein